MAISTVAVRLLILITAPQKDLFTGDTAEYAGKAKGPQGRAGDASTEMLCVTSVWLCEHLTSGGL